MDANGGIMMWKLKGLLEKGGHFVKKKSLMQQGVI